MRDVASIPSLPYQYLGGILPLLQVKRLQGQVAVAEAQITVSQGQTGEVRKRDVHTNPHIPSPDAFSGTYAESTPSYVFKYR